MPWVAGWVTMLCAVAVHSAHGAPLGDCDLEPTLEGRGDVVFCDPFESDTWWADNGYVKDGRKTPPLDSVDASQMTYSSIVDDGCLSGRCLKLDTPRGVTRSLSIHWPLANAGLKPEELYFRYHFKIGSTWTPDACDSAGNTVWPAGGKFWGFADPRANTYDAPGQCGNGGAASDGVHCWSARGVFNSCDELDGEANCRAVPDARVRIGSYIYVPDNGTTHGANGIWDGIADDSSLGDDYSSQCRRDEEGWRDPNCYCVSANNFYCGVGTGGQLQVERWYAIETYVKMNTPGEADGIIRGWVDDVLSYEKTNVRFREVGHDDLHVRNLWLNTYKGGTQGNCEDGKLFYDQLVIATEPIGAVGTVADPGETDDTDDTDEPDGPTDDTDGPTDETDEPTRDTDPVGDLPLIHISEPPRPS